MHSVQEESSSAYCVPLFFEASEKAMLNRPEFLLLGGLFSCLFVYPVVEANK